MNSSAHAFLHASTNSSSVAFLSPHLRFSFIVPENNTFFCKTIETSFLRVSIS